MMFDIKPLLPINRKIARGRFIILAIGFIYLLIEVISFYWGLGKDGNNLFKVAVRSGLAFLIFYKIYHGSMAAKRILITLLSFLTTYLLVFYIVNPWGLIYDSVQIYLIFDILYYGGSNLLLIFSPSVKEFMSVQRKSSNLDAAKKYKLDPELTWIWTWGGRFFGYLDNHYLWSYTGKNIGKLSGRDIYDSEGRYLGEICHDRLITNISKKSLISNGYNRLVSRTAHEKSPNVTPYDFVENYEDFPMLEA